MEEEEDGVEDEDYEECLEDEEEDWWEDCVEDNPYATADATTDETTDATADATADAMPGKHAHTHTWQLDPMRLRRACCRVLMPPRARCDMCMPTSHHVLPLCLRDGAIHAGCEG